MTVLGAKCKIIRGATRIQSKSFLLRTSYACDITVATVGAYTTFAFGPPSKVHSRSILALRSHHPQLSVAVTNRYYSFSKVIIVTLY